MTVEVASPQRFLHVRLPKVCVAVAGSEVSELLEQATSTIRDNPFIELRLDYLPHPLHAIPKIKHFLDENRQVTAVATCRRIAGGGKFRGSIASQLEVLLKAARAGCQFVDLEIESMRSLKPKDIAGLHGAASLIVSHHDFKATKGLSEALAHMQAYPADFIKIATTARSLSDNIEMVHFLEQNGGKGNLVALCMGEQGLPSRVLGVRAGSAFTFAAAVAGQETAPGQVLGRTLRDVYRIDEVDAATKVYGVAGDPVAHSLSPLMMNAAFRRENLNAVYLALQARKVDDLLKCIREIPIHGLSVTMPFKQAIMDHLDNADPFATRTGACNTVVRSQGKLYGFNTDVTGIIRPLEHRIALRGAKVLVLGAGGAARAAVFGLVDRGAEVLIANRTPAAAQKLARQSGAKYIGRKELGKRDFDVIVNATPLGMNGTRNQSFLQDHELRARIVFDMVYNPLETKLIKMAKAQGLVVITGMEMFVNQGARQFEIWTGKPAPENEMLRVVLHALRGGNQNGNGTDS